MLEVKYEKVTSIEEGVRRLMTVRDEEIPDFTLERRGDGGLCDMLVLSGERIPLLSWRHEPRMNSMKNYGCRAPEENCAINTVSFVGKDTSLDALIYRELDIAEYTLRSKIESVTAFVNGDACNLLGKCKSGAMLGLELGATMAVGTVPQFNHRIITKHGMASDRTVNNVVEQSGVYLFADGDARAIPFDDGEYYLYGLTPADGYTAVYIRAIIKGTVDKDELVRQDEHLRRVLAAVHKSAKSGAREKVSEVE